MEKNIQVGDMVGFTDEYTGVKKTGQVVEVNPKNVVVKTSMGVFSVARNLVTIVR